MPLTGPWSSIDELRKARDRSAPPSPTARGLTLLVSVAALVTYLTLDTGWPWFAELAVVGVPLVVIGVVIDVLLPGPDIGSDLPIDLGHKCGLVIRLAGEPELPELARAYLRHSGASRAAAEQAQLETGSLLFVGLTEESSRDISAEMEGFGLQAAVGPRSDPGRACVADDTV